MLVALAVACSACSDNDGGESTIDTLTTARLSLTARQAQVCDKTVAFSDALLDEANRQLGHEDAFMISPLSAQMVLSMAANGCEGETLDQILKCLNISSGEISDLNDLNSTLLKQLPDFSANKMTIGNALFYDPELFSGSLNDNFASILSKSYGADIYKCPASLMPKQVNSWVSRINGSSLPLLDENQKDCSTALVNGLRLSAMWVTKPETGEMTFHNANGSSTKIKTISEESSWSYETSKGLVVTIYYANTALYM